jgi:hypothetical protein
VQVSNAVFSGELSAAGVFTGGGPIIGFADGIILSTGSVHSVPGPNSSGAESTSHDGPGDAQLSALSGGRSTFDAAVLQFNFVPSASQIFIQFVFSSDEYNEFVGQEFNDVFAFFVNGVNCARNKSGDAVSINTINLFVHPEQYRNNEFPGGTIDTEMDGLTTVLTCQATVIPNATNTIRMAIADAADDAYDSNVFIKAGSFTTIPPNVPPFAAAGADLLRECTGVNTSVALSGALSSDSDGSITAYRWLRNGTQVATGVAPTVSLPLGVHTIVLEVTDNGGATATDTLFVTVQDTTPPSLTLGALPVQLLPADQMYRPVAVNVSSLEACGGALTFSGSIVSNEPDDAPARDGVSLGDIRVTRPGGAVSFSSVFAPAVVFNPLTDVLELRAERRGASQDRIYSISVAVQDARGNQRNAVTEVRVPR